MDFDQLFPNKYLKAGELQGRDVTLTIAGVELEELPGDGGKTEVKGAMTFRETKKSLILNKTNGLCIRAMFGRKTEAWIGKRITLFPAKVDFNDSDIAVRVRGSPDIEKNIDFELRLARKKPRKVRMLKTVKGQAIPEPEPEPGSDVDAEQFGGSDFPEEAAQ